MAWSRTGLADWLNQPGYEAQHVNHVGLHNAEDLEIWKRGLKEDWVIVTKDEDAKHAKKNSYATEWLLR